MNAAPRPTPSRGAAVLALQARALMHERFDAAAAAVVDQLVQVIGCERVSLGLYMGGRLCVAAVSGGADLNPRHSGAQLLASAMAEALEQRSPVIHPMAAGASPVLSLAHGDLSRANGGAAVYTMPITTRNEILGAMLFERRGGFDAGTLQSARDATMFVGPVLALQQRAETGVGGRMAGWLGAPKQRPQGAVASHRRKFVLGAAVALALLACWPVTHRVVAPARVEGAVQQLVAAPVDGFLGSVLVRPGETVRAGQELARLEGRELTLESDKWAAEIAYLDKEYREALSNDDAAPIVTTRAKLEQAQSQYALALQQLERATLRAPMDGVLISGDLSRSVGMPVKRGQELMTVATAGSHRIVAEVDEQDIAALRIGQKATVLFGALPGDAKSMTVARIAPVATPLDGRNMFEVEGTPTGGAGPGAELRPGMRGVARIEIGEGALGAVWWERAGNALRRLSWRLLG